MRFVQVAVISGLILFAVQPAPAQDDDDGGMIQSLLEDNLSGAGRDVKIRGFEGLLAGQARMAELTIADEDGVWLVLRDAVLDWNRAALLLGNLSVEELSAAELILTRLPAEDSSAKSASRPKAEASGFSLPELPVSVRVDKLSIARAELGEAVFGHETVLDLNGSVLLADGDGTIDIRTERLDGPEDHVSIQGSFDNESRLLALDLRLQEESGGLVSNLLSIPGEPSIALSVEGEGPLSDFNAEIKLSTDGQERVTGDVTLTANEEGDTRFAASIGSDITPVLPPELRAFFGDDTRLIAKGARSADGILELEKLSITSQSLDLQGNALIGSDWMPRSFDLKGTVANSDGTPVRLPMPGVEKQVGSVALTAAYDEALGDGWTLDAEVSELSLKKLDVGNVSLSGTGTITQSRKAAVTADIDLNVKDLTLADSKLSEAVGDSLSAEVELNWTQGSALDITDISLTGADYGLVGEGDLKISDRSVVVSGNASVNAEDLSRFSAISGQDLTGTANISLSGDADVLGGIFNLTTELEADNLSIGQETADQLLAGPVTISAAAKRDTDGTVLDNLTLRSSAINLDASGRVGGGASDIGFDAELTDVGLVLAGHEGPLTLSGDAHEDSPDDWRVELGLAGPYGLAGTVSGAVNPGDSDLTLDLSLPDIAPLVPGHSGPATISGSAAEDAPGTWKIDVDVTGPYDLASSVAGIVAPDATDVSLELSLPDVSPLAPGVEGAVALSGTAAQTANGNWDLKLGGTGPYDAMVDLDGAIGAAPAEVNFKASLPDLSPLVPGIDGALTAEGTAKNTPDGQWQLVFDAAGPYDAAAHIDGLLGGDTKTVDLDLSVPDISPLVPQVSGPLTASANAAQDADGRWTVGADIAGPYQSTVRADGTYKADAAEAKLTVAVPDIAPLAPGYTGAILGTVAASQGDNGSWDISLDATGPYGSTVAANGAVGSDKTGVSFQAALADIAAFAPGLSGGVGISGDVAQADGGAWNINLDATGPYNGTASVSGIAGPENTAVDLVLSMPSIAPFAPGISGGVEARGSVAQGANGFDVNLETNGPQGAATAISGTVAADFSTVAINAKGSAPLGLANGVIEPHILNGTAEFDLSVNGAPSLQSVSGTVSTNGTQLSLPTLQQSLEGIGVQITLNGDTVQLDATANGPAGGSLGASGSIQLSGGFNADLQANLNEFVLTDPLLFKTLLNGGVSIAGPLTGGANIKGRIGVGRTEIRLPDGGLGFGGAIPIMKHLNEPGAVFLTRQRAGLVEIERKAAEAAASGPTSGPEYGLDIVVDAPEQIYIRGRGLDVEMGGAVQITGTTLNMNPIGEIEVIRGRLDILGQKLDMSNGTVSLAGGLQPYLDLTASSKRDDFEFLARITGPVNDPKFDLISLPDLPEDEVLAHFLFGTSITSLSALQAVQMASALATLSGKGGPGVLGGVREGLGLDGLDLATTGEGETELRAGKYLSDNIYTEFVADSDGDTEIDLNIDVTKSFTLKGTTDSKGESSIGIYFERDY